MLDEWFVETASFPYQVSQGAAGPRVPWMRLLAISLFALQQVSASLHVVLRDRNAVLRGTLAS